MQKTLVCLHGGKLRKILLVVSILALVLDIGFLTALIGTPTTLAQVAPICPNPGDIVINEIMQNPNAVLNGNGEWFEVYNPTGSAVDLQDCVISDNNGDSHVIDPVINVDTSVVPAGGYLVLGRNPVTGTNGGVNIDYAYEGAFPLANDVGDEVVITCCDTEIDRVEYTGSTPWPNPTGKSMILANPSLDNNVGSNWCVSTSAYGAGDKGTPGSQNDLCGFAYCGNGNVEGGEECDDGNWQDGDGCSATCTIETLAPSCGDGVLDTGEACDDGNNIDGDGCSAVCVIETPAPTCGDGTVDSGEECDDGNNVSGDGCSSVCTIETFCGDGTVDTGEECDDGNTTDGDGCSSQCLTEVPTCEGEVCTSLNRGVTGGAGPIIKAKWEMLRETTGWHWIVDSTHSGGGYYRLDDSTAAGAQFTPPNVWDANMDYTVCAIVTDPNGVADIDGVYVDIYYPENIAFHEDANNPDDPAHADYGELGCGAFIEENELLPLPKMDGYNLFCGTIKNDNNNLPKFFPMPTGGDYNYDEICGATGELMKETAKVYCDDKDLTWEDPAGNYRVEVFAQDKVGNFSYTDPAKADIDYNEFTYLEAQGYDIDFTAINYGEVALNSHKIISGDLTWGNNVPSIRNTGNTRLHINIWQNDMGLGKVGTTWNVKYDARIGNEELDWKNYWPEQTQRLEDILDLSEIEEMDFSVLITKFPSISATYTGVMDLSADKAVFRQCLPQDNHLSP